MSGKTSSNVKNRTDQTQDKAVIHTRLLELSDSLFQSMNRTQKVIKDDLEHLKKSEFNTENRIASVSKEEKHIKEFNEQSRYGTFFVWIVLIACTVVFFFIIMFLRAIG